MPPGAALLATNDACPVQAYRVGDRLYATQFHPEPTAARLHRAHGGLSRRRLLRRERLRPVAGRVLAASVTEPVRLLRAFARSFGPAG